MFILNIILAPIYGHLFSLSLNEDVEENIIIGQNNVCCIIDVDD